MRLLSAILFCLTILSCSTDESEVTLEESASNTSAQKVFRLLSPAESGVDFRNDIREDNDYNFYAFQYTYNGGGVAIGDLNNDGLADLYFTGNQVQDRLYINQGDLKFKDITETAGISNEGAFNFGVTMSDVNQDGFQDIYVCRSGHKRLGTGKANLLFINNGDETFTESAKAYGVADTGYSIQSAFFDYDRDGDLDLYLTNHPVDYGQNLKVRLENMDNPDYEVSDRLYRNNGNETFSDVSKQAGILNYGHGLGLAIWDINRDGWDDIYVGNDYQSPDYVYINNKNGSFTDRLTEYFQHIPYYSMGVDVGDIDNDGLLDINVVEMLPDDYKRKVMNVTSMEEDNYYIFERVGFHHQYMRNVLSKNNGNGTFTDVALKAGVEASDWSWSTLIEDYNNDGRQDIFISNGYLRDMQDKDYMKKAQIMARRSKKLNLSQLDSISSSVKLQNHMYSNLGQLEFENVAQSWGLPQKAFSGGAASADLDNDGDLDLVVSNTNLNKTPDPAFVYENLMSDGRESSSAEGGFIQFEFKGPKGNLDGEGVLVEIGNSDGNPSCRQVKEMRRTRGFQSAGPALLHFGVGGESSVNVMVTWPDQKIVVGVGIATGRRHLIDYKDAQLSGLAPEQINLLKSSVVKGLDFVHKDQVLEEFKNEKQLPMRMSMQGPGGCVGDVNGDKLDDFFLCGAAGQSAELYLNTGSGVQKKSGPWSSHAASEGIVSEFADIDGDGDLDLYVGNGSVEFSQDISALQDELYLNDGKGNFSEASDRLPKSYAFTSTVQFADIDGDGDLDIFAGSRCVPFKYGEHPFSFLFLNEGNRFVSAAEENAPGLKKIGMITDAAWTDLDSDGDQDLVVVGDWMSVKTFINENGSLQDKSTDWLDDMPGSWNCIEIADLNADGRPDILLGNDGQNMKYKPSAEAPLRMYTGDLDGDNSRDIVIAEKKGNFYYPDRSFGFLKNQFPKFKERFKWYEDFANQDVDHLFGTKLNSAELHTISELSSMVLINKGGTFNQITLPVCAQLSSINDFAVSDLNGDGHLDILFAGNELYLPIETGSLDGGTGNVLLGNGDGTFREDEELSSALQSSGMIRKILALKINDSTHFLLLRNSGKVDSYTFSN